MKILWEWLTWKRRSNPSWAREEPTRLSMKVWGWLSGKCSQIRSYRSTFEFVTCPPVWKCRNARLIVWGCSYRLQSSKYPTGTIYLCKDWFRKSNHRGWQQGNSCKSSDRASVPSGCRTWAQSNISSSPGYLIIISAHQHKQSFGLAPPFLLPVPSKELPCSSRITGVSAAPVAPLLIFFNFCSTPFEFLKARFQ